jgi:hypothetical protein
MVCIAGIFLVGGCINSTQNSFIYSTNKYIKANNTYQAVCIRDDNNINYKNISCLNREDTYFRLISDDDLDVSKK